MEDRNVLYDLLDQRQGKIYRKGKYYVKMYAIMRKNSFISQEGIP